MPRPIRIEYEGAFHHVMNRGRNHQAIFHDERYFNLFLKTLKEASDDFSAVIHAYCLMTNHFHLIIETPKANLNRIMQHICGIYTQRHNRLAKKDGTLFRGRYKSVLVDEDSYLLQLSRYVHRNPIEVRESMVAKLEDYPWSSYPAYINGSVSPDWLYRERTYQMLGHKQRYRGYRRFVEKGVDEDIKRFYSKGNILSVLGNKEFKQERQEEFEETDIVKLRQILQDKPTINEMMEIICRVTKHSEAEINVLVAGKRTNNPFRAFAIYYCSKYCIENKQLIAGYFGLAHPGSLSHSISRIQNEIAQGVWINEVNRIEKELYIVK